MDSEQDEIARTPDKIVSSTDNQDIIFELQAFFARSHFYMAKITVM